MRIKRRNFLKRSLQISAGMVLIPPFLFNKMESFGKANPIKPAATPDPSQWKDDEINIAWIGHATVLINFYGTIILTDPVLYNRVGLYFFGLIFGPARFTSPALELDQIPKPDLVLLSHGHMDHTDFKTLVNITDKYPGQVDCVTAYNTKDISEELNWKSIQEMDWEDELEIAGLKLKALEVKHFGWRLPWEWDRSKGYMKTGRSYNAFVIEKNGKKILFGGDTAFSDKFMPVKDQGIEIVIMPIGAYNPWRQSHCNPEEALIMASEHIGAKYFIPIHCNTFRQGQEPINEPLTWLKRSYKNYPIDAVIQDIGETFKLKT
jgi:L-ascorbate metabolism protein UlaG (beta-lactamase superfamily)